MSSTVKRHGTRQERAALYEAAKCLNHLLAAAKGDNSRCATFDTLSAPKPHDGETAAEYGDRVRTYYMDHTALYIESWIQPMLNAALASMNGEPTRDDVEILRESVRF